MSKRIQDLKSPLTIWRQKAAAILRRPYDALSPNQRFWIGFGVLSLSATLLVSNPFWRTQSAQIYSEREIARETIVSPADITVVDDEASESTRLAVMSSISPTFMYEPRRADEAVQSFRSAWEDLQRRADPPAPGRANVEAPTEVQWTGAGGPELGRVLGARQFSNNELSALERMLREHASGDVYGDSDRQYLGDEIKIIDRQRPTDIRQAMRPVFTMTSVSDARARLKESIGDLRSLSDEEKEAFYAALAPLIQPSLVYDSAATESEKLAAAQDVEPQTITLKRGQKIVGEGELITADVMAQLAALEQYGSSTRRVNRFIGLFLIVTALFWIAWKFIEHRGIVPRLALSEQMTFALFGSIVLVQTAIMALLLRVAEFTALQNVRAPLNDPNLWSLALPFAFGSLIMALLADRRTAFFTGIFCALLAGFMAPRGLEFTIYAIIGSSVAAYGIGRYRSRQTVTIAGSLIGLASAGTAIAIIAFTQQPFILNTILLAVACGLASGIITAAVTAVFLPMFESLFGVLTDVKLLELSNADLPVLGQLALRAPGTNQHSHAVGQLAEEACRVVGGNALLARIGALYHDIGKSAAPEHFVENQLGKNPHDKLKPVQSAKIIISHVTYGTKLAKEMGLPQRIIDFIPQHHGTRTLHYFLKKAQAEAREEDDISENDFRYPGPKPQFREAAIMMIADSCEAAARSLAEPTPENIRYIVTKIIDAILSDDQLDECDLTLRELTQIREAMIRSLVAIYHSRVDYPGYNPPTSQSGQYKIVPSQLDSEERGLRYADPRDIPISKGGEIEDEAVHRTYEPGQKRKEKEKETAG